MMESAAPPGFAPVDEADWPDGLDDPGLAFARGLNVYRTMANHSDLLRAWGPLREHVVNQTALGPELSEVAILRTAHRLGAGYEWAHHIERARKRGVSDRRIASMSGPVRDMEGQDAIVAQGVDELFEDGKVSQATLEALSREVGRAAVFDLFATVGFYSTLGYMLNSLGVPLEDAAAEALRKRPLPGT